MLRVSLVQRNKARRIMTWFARIFDTETKAIRYRSLGTTRKTEAYAVMVEMQAEGAFSEKSADARTIGDAVDAYLENLRTRGANSGTMETARNALSCLSPIRHERLSEIDRKTLYDAFMEKERDMAPSTWNQKKAFVKTCLKYAIGYFGLDIRNPADIIPSRKNRPKERDFWTPEQVDRILDAAPSPSMRLLWSLMAFAGLRIHEAMKARPEDIREGFLYVVGKGDKSAKVPVSSRLSEEISKGGWDFSGICRSGSLKALEKAARKALPEGFSGKATNHRLRHSFASNLCRNGCNPKSLQRLLRHSNIGTTLQIYSHVMEDDLRDDIEKMFTQGVDRS